MMSKLTAVDNGCFDPEKRTLFAPFSQELCFLSNICNVYVSIVNLISYAQVLA